MRQKKGYTSRQVLALSHKLGLPGGTAESVVAATLNSILGTTGTKRETLNNYFSTRPEINGVEPFKKKTASFVYSGSAVSKPENFYESREWRELRYKALVMYGAVCQCCGASRATGAVIHVDHIKPRSKFPELMLSIENLQILCADCNIGKSNKDSTDWRS